jgi:hypothetical protein
MDFNMWRGSGEVQHGGRLLRSERDLALVFSSYDSYHSRPSRAGSIPPSLTYHGYPVIPPIEFNLPLVLLVHTALLMHTPGSQLVMAQAIEKLAGNVVSGEGVVDATLDQRTVSPPRAVSTTSSPLSPCAEPIANFPNVDTTFTQLLGFKTNSTRATAVKIPSSTSS